MTYTHETVNLDANGNVLGARPYFTAADAFARARTLFAYSATVLRVGVREIATGLVTEVRS